MSSRSTASTWMSRPGRFTGWPQSAIFVVEDDSQAGLDHVDGHRAPIQIISPWAQHGVVDDHYYTQITMIRTIEQILGIHPKWLTRHHTTGPNAMPDYANPEQLNRYVWYQTTGWSKPYPGDNKIYAPDQVPGAYLPSPDNS